MLGRNLTVGVDPATFKYGAEDFGEGWLRPRVDISVELY